MLETDCILGITKHFQCSLCPNLEYKEKVIWKLKIYSLLKKKADLIEIEVQGIYPLTTLRVPEAPF